VLAVGNPFGFEETVTEGIISSKGRPNRIDAFGDYLQTDAAINPGNSGGPLIDLKGEVIGINTAIISRSGTSSGIGFAIPSNTVRMALESVLKKGRIIRGYLGIETTAAAPGQVTSNNSNGVPVAAVMPNSPAAEANIQRGDIIQKFDGHEVHNIAELRRLVAQTELDRKVELQVDRKGKQLTLSTKLKEQPPNYGLARAVPNTPNVPDANTPDEPDDNDNDQVAGGSVLGSIEVRDLTPQLAQRLGVPSSVRGVVVSRVGSEIADGQIRAGDIIEAVNQEPVTSVQEYQRVIQSIDPNQPQVVSVCRQRTRFFVVIQPR
jgi:serine protease Do